MSITILSNLDPFTLFTTGNYPVAGGWLGSFFTGATLGTGLAYYDRLDFLYGLVTNSAGGNGVIYRIDPLLAANTGTLFNDMGNPPDMGGTVARALHIGEWNKALNQQKMYQHREGSNTLGFNEVNPLDTSVVLASDPWPLVGSFETRSGVLSTVVGHYTACSGSWHIFETLGVALQMYATLRHTDNVTYIGVPILVNLTTGLATWAGFATSYGIQSHKLAAPGFTGENFNFNRGQFVADDDSALATPKGELWMFSGALQALSDGTHWRGFVRVIDWNPSGITGTPSRVHLRERLLTGVDFLENSPGSLDGLYNVSPLQFLMVLHPRTNRLVTYNATNQGAALGANQSKFFFISPSVAVTGITEPSAKSKIANGKTISFGVDAVGSLGERVGGIPINFSLQRVSTVKEVVPNNGVAQTETVANTPIDPSVAAISPVVVIKNGSTILTEGVHYTVNRGTGQITFIAPEQTAGATYTVTYRHLATPASPPHGNLLNTSAITDTTGTATARVKYTAESPAEDRWDRLTAVQG